MHVRFYLIATEYISGICAILYIIFAIMTKSEYSLDQSDISLYKTNWDSSPIMDIFKSQDEGCPEGSEPIINNKFPPLLGGCDCSLSNQMSYRDKIFKKKCDQEQLDSNCYDINAVDESALPFWKGSKLCIKRLNKNFWQLMSNVTKSVTFCPEGYKSCGIFDSIGNLLCLPENDICPINYMKILNKEEKLNEELENFQQIELNENYNLYFSNSFTNNKIVTNILVNLQHFCSNPTKGLFGMNNYPLNTLKGDNFCGEKYFDNNQEDYFDPRFTILDQYPSKDFFTENNLDTYLNNTFQYPKPEEDSDIYLFMINYFGWNTKCYKKGNDSYSEQNLFKYEDNSNNAKAIKYFIIITFISFFVTLLSFGFVIFLSKGDNKVGTIIVMQGLKIIICVLTIVIASYFIRGNKKYMESFNDFKEENCVEQYTLYAFELFYKGVYTKKKWFILTIALSAFEILLKFLFYIFLCLFNHDLKKKTA